MVVGGVITYFQARKASAEALERDSKERLDKSKAAAFRVIVKLSKIISSLGAVHFHIERCVAKALEQKHQGPLWTALEPLAGTSKRVDFEADELAVFVPMNEYDALNALLSMDDKHNVVMETMQTYFEKRSEFGSIFGAKMDGRRGVTEMNEEEHNRAGPRIAELTDLAEALRREAKESFDEASALVAQVGPKFRTYFGDPAFPLLAMAKVDVDALTKG